MTPLKVRPHLVVPEAHHTKFVRGKAAITPLVLNGIGVLTAIDFDHAARLEADKVRDEWTDRNLPAKLAARKSPIAQGKPQFAFGIRHARTQFARPPTLLPVDWWFCGRTRPYTPYTLSRSGRG
jgi:hypothetical protein